jgi:predicted RNase H-like nuclease (RuvC/YqgF family)
MLPRAPVCVFTPEDVELCVRETGHDKETIKNWEKCLRFRMFKKSHAEIEEYLKASPESLEIDLEHEIEEYREVILKQSATIEALQKANEKLDHYMTNMDKKMMDYDERIKNQTFAISKLNEDVRKKAEKIDQLQTLSLQLTQQNQTLLHSNDNSVTIEQIRGLFIEYCAGMKRKHGDGDD